MKARLWCIALVLVPGGRAWAEQPSQEELVREVRELRAKVERLEQQQPPGASTTPSQVDETRQRVLADAHQRSLSLTDTKILPTWQDGKFLLRSEDGNFVLHPWLQFQLRSVTNLRDRADSDEQDIQSGFEIRRMKLGFDGNVFSPSTKYLFNWATSRKDGSFQLEEAWVRQDLNKAWAVMGGQFKDPFAHESQVSSKRLLAAERTLVTDFFTGGDNFVQGVSGFYSRRSMRLQAAFHDGGRNNFNDNFEDFPTNNADWGAAARLEYKFDGDWKAYEDFSALGTKKEMLVFGGGVDYTEAGNTGILLHTIDVQYEHPSGVGLYGAFLGRYTHEGPAAAGALAAADQDLYDQGFIAQASYLVTPRWEPFVRYEFLQLDQAGLSAASDNNLHAVTGGINYYWHGHDAKFTLDLVYLPDGSPVADDGAGILASDSEAELILRAQLQLLL